MAWMLVIVAGLLEVAWATGLKYSEGFSRPLPSIFTIVTMIISFALLAIAMRTLPLGTAYVVWVGIGAIGTVIIGVLLFKEPMSAAKFICTALILGGVVGLKFVSDGH